MLKQNAVSTAVFTEQILQEWLVQVQEEMRIMSDHSFAGTEVGEVLNDALGTKGKMIRPRLLLLSSAFGTEWEANREKLCTLAAMVELTHLASLIHDDIVDEAPVRRGAASVQGKYGKDAAVFAGDFLMARVNYYEAVKKLNGAAAILSSTVEKMCVGEIGQARWRYREDVSKEQYLNNIQGKTTALFRACFRIGAAEGGCTEDTAAILGSIGESLGILFQMRDDLLDFTADGCQVGKETHKDFRDGIYTMPVLMALRSGEGRKKLLPIIQENRVRVLTDGEIREMEKIVIESGGVEKTRQEIGRYRESIMELLGKLEQKEPAALLKKLVEKLEV